MTHPTKAIYGTLLKDFVKVGKNNTEEGLFSDKDLEASLKRIDVVDFHQTVDLDGIKVSTPCSYKVQGSCVRFQGYIRARASYTRARPRKTVRRSTRIKFNE